jgi:hypothetical protein
VIKVEKHYKRMIETFKEIIQENLELFEKLDKEQLDLIPLEQNLKKHLALQTKFYKSYKSIKNLSQRHILSIQLYAIEQQLIMNQ